MWTYIPCYLPLLPGLVGVAIASDGKAGAVVEINAETDFAAKNDLFTSMISQVSGIAAAGGTFMISLGRSVLLRDFKNSSH